MTQHLCPQLHLWRQIYSILEEAQQQPGDDGLPPPPPVFNMQGWMLSTDTQKQQRWEATRTWAREHGLDHLIPEIADDEYYTADE
ncbi:hypothetical protein ACFL43_02995 [Thermodesulfobacteriota bacterium]